MLKTSIANPRPQVWRMVGAFTLTASNALMGTACLAQDTGYLMDAAATLVPLPSIHVSDAEPQDDFLKAEVWKGQGRRGVNDQVPFKPAEILYGDPGKASSKSSRMSPRSTKRTNLATPAAILATDEEDILTGESQNATSGRRKTDVVRSATMNDAMVAHELLTKAKQSASTGDLATARQLTGQARDLLGKIPAQELPAENLRRLEALLSKMLDEGGKPDNVLRDTNAGIQAEQIGSVPATRSAANRENPTTATPPAAIPSRSTPSPLPAIARHESTRKLFHQADRNPSTVQPVQTQIIYGAAQSGLSTTVKSSQPAPGPFPAVGGSTHAHESINPVSREILPPETQFGGPSFAADGERAQDHVAYGKLQQQPIQSTEAPGVGVMVNFGPADDAWRQYAGAGARRSSAAEQHEHRAESGVAAGDAFQAHGGANVIYFAGGVLIGLIALCSSLLVLVKLIVPRAAPGQAFPGWGPNWGPQQVAYPNFAQQVVPQPYSPQPPAPQPPAPQPAAGAGSAASFVQPTRTNRAVELTPGVAPTLPVKEKPSTGILEGIFEDNLRMQGQLGRVAKTV